MDVKLSKYGSEFGLIKLSVIFYVIFENAALSMAFLAIQIFIAAFVRDRKPLPKIHMSKCVFKT